MSIFGNFLSDNRGNVMMLAGGCIVTVMLGSAIAVDYAQALAVKKQLQANLDMAVLQGAKSTTDPSTHAAKAFDSLTDQLAAIADIDVVERSFALSDSGTTLTAEATVRVDMSFMDVFGVSTMDVGTNSGVSWSSGLGDSAGCVYLTDPRNTGLEMDDGGSFTTDCPIHINTRGTAIEIEDGGIAEFSQICANGHLEVEESTITPSSIDRSCEVIVDPFAGMAGPSELQGSCTTSSSKNARNGTTIVLSPGVHCGKVTAKNNGVIELEPGNHYFKSGLELESGGTLTGDDVLVILDIGIEEYEWEGIVDLTGRQTGDHKGFVIYAEDYAGSSNSIEIEEGAVFNAEGVIYLPNTKIEIDDEINTIVTRSILVTDRIEMDDGGSFVFKMKEESDTPLPDALTSGVKNLRLMY